MHYVWEHSPTTGSQRLMLLAIADAANDDGVCFPGVGTLAKKLNTTERNAQKLIRSLAKSGEITIHAGKGIKTAHGWTNRYNMTFSGVSISTPHAKSVSKMTPQEVNASTPQEVSKVTPYPIVEPSVEPKEREAAQSAEPAPAPQIPLSPSKPEAQEPEPLPFTEPERDVTVTTLTPGQAKRLAKGESVIPFNDTVALMELSTKTQALLTAYRMGFPEPIRPTPDDVHGYETKARAMAAAGITPEQVTAAVKALYDAGVTKINIWKAADHIQEEKVRAHQAKNGITKQSADKPNEQKPIGDAYRRIVPNRYHPDGSAVYEDELGAAS